jgi:peptidoglycan hydrolase-like protein with peptidoglycan-binding domain
MSGRRLLAGIASLFAATGVAGAATADRPRPDPNVAGLQTMLAVKRFYRGPIDGIRGPQTVAAIRAFQRRQRFASAALGRLGRPRYGSRVLRRGMVGLDVAGLQFELRYHGFPNRERAEFGRQTFIALLGFQRFAGIRADGIAGRSTYDALESPPPTAPKLRTPIPVVEHVSKVGAAVELSCPYATPVAASAGGTVVFAANRRGGYGYTVITRDRRGFEIVYAHLARIDVAVHQRVVPGAMVGLAGWTGKKRAVTTLRIEIRLRGAHLDAAAALK